MKTLQTIFSKFGVFFVGLLIISSMPLISFASSKETNDPVRSQENFNYDPSDSLIDYNFHQFYSTVSGHSAETIEELFSENNQVSSSVLSSFHPSISSLKIYPKDGLIVVSGTLNDAASSVDFETTGTFYRESSNLSQEGLQGLVLGELNDFGNIHFVQFKVDTTNKKISIILQKPTIII